MWLQLSDEHFVNLKCAESLSIHSIPCTEEDKLGGPIESTHILQVEVVASFGPSHHEILATFLVEEGRDEKQASKDASAFLKKIKEGIAAKKDFLVISGQPVSSGTPAIRPMMAGVSRKH